MKHLLPLTIILLTLFSGPVSAQKYDSTWVSLDSRPCPGWFLDAKFGIFITWGVSSVPSWKKVESARYASYSEWYYASVMENDQNGGRAFHEKNFGKDFDYHAFGPMFRAELWNPAYWAECFKKSGARYVVLIAKHHDGYCLWPTKVPQKQNWNSMAVGPKRDIVGELTEAVRSAGLKMGLYYSIPDWESVPRPGGIYQVNMKYVQKYGTSLNTYLNDIYKPQLHELVTWYKPSIVWADAGEWHYDDRFWGTREFLAWLYNESPVHEEVVVNDRFCKGMPGKHGDFYSSEYQDANVTGHPWEENRGMGGSFGFNRAENLTDYQSSEQLVEELIDVVSRGGNFLLNVGPTSDGRIDLLQQQRLADIGEWLAVNGEAIYGTRAYRGGDAVVSADFPATGKTAEPDKAPFRLTTKGSSLYVICTEYPKGKLTVKGHSGGNKIHVSLLGHPEELKYQVSGDQIIIDVPCLYPSEYPCRYAWVFKIGNY